MVKLLNISFLLLLIPAISSAQKDLKSGVLTNFKTKITLSKDWQLQTKLEARQILWESSLSQKIATDYRYERTDIGIFALKKYGNNAFGIGYMIRLSESLLIQRFSQLYSFKQDLPAVQIKHRFLTDQTFSPNESPKYRYRYRLGFRHYFLKKTGEQSIFFFKSNQELLFLIQKDVPIDLELRLIPIIGFAASKNSIIELGIDSRVGEVRNNPMKNQLWLYFGYIKGLK